MSRFFSLLFTLLLCQTISSQEITDVISFSESFSTVGSAPTTYLPLADKSTRLNSKAGKFDLNFDSEVPDSIKQAIKVAADIWESYIRSSCPIEVDIKFLDLDNGIDIRTDVFCSIYNEIKYPKSLYINTLDLNLEDKKCGIININKQSRWVCDFSSNSTSDGGNVIFAALRSIGHILGFGSSATKRTIRNTTSIFFAEAPYKTAFDQMILSKNGKRLSDIPSGSKNRNNAQLEQFSQPTGSDDENFVGHVVLERKLYAPSSFVASKSMIYLDNPSSIMHHSFEYGEKKLGVDTTTTNILKELGWSFNDPKVEIIGIGIDSTGICSAYEGHQFTLKNDFNQNISAPFWQLIVETKDGDEMILNQQSGGQTFAVDALTDIENLKINVNGDIYGTVKCRLKIDDVETELSYRVSFELAPVINYYTDVLIRNVSDYFYDCSFTVSYSGCNWLRVNMEQDGMTTVLSKIIEEPFLAHANVTHISKDFYTWIDIIAQNKYGETMETIEIPPLESKDFEFLSISPTGFIDLTNRINVYDLNGNCLMLNASGTDLNDLPRNKIYILNILKDGKIVKQVKYLKK